jgi:hypothetical protein
MSRLNWLNPYTGKVENDIMVALADQTEMNTLHMVTADPFRTPTFTPFADPNWFFFSTGGTTTCATPSACASIPARTSQSFAWNHGDIQDEIASTWAGIVGPGVANRGVDTETWTDHTDLRPTMLSLLGLKDDYVQDGRLVREALTGWALPDAVQHSGRFVQLASLYKQLNAPFGSFAMNTLKASTKALASGSASNDSVYTSLEGQIASLTSQRNVLAGEIKDALNQATFDSKPLSNQEAGTLVAKARGLLDQAAALASS